MTVDVTCNEARTLTHCRLWTPQPSWVRVTQKLSARGKSSREVQVTSSGLPDVVVVSSEFREYRLAGLHGAGPRVGLR